ncbi:MAG TPA: glycosyltransferase [Candidatus Omnitrophota bacterium]|nr:glycosyltransferase [Candidatus Omnitrophota bacterium]HPT07567.1 glycosyltransferase [Candidatus Omnitrophota bacterium]
MQAKRILLMYISEVSGHHSATIAIEKAIKSLAPNTEILNINAFNYTNPLSEKIINKLYMGVIKATPQIWDFLYDNPSVVKKLDKIKQKIHKFNSPKLKKLFNSFKPDVVACSQAFPCGMVADYKKNYGSKLPLVAVLTDYIPHAYWIYDEVNYFIAPSFEVGKRLQERGVPELKIRTFGIPFDHKFNAPVIRDEVLKSMGLVPGVFTLLIMGGGQGLGPVKIIAKSLDELHGDFQTIFVCGTNKRLYNSLVRKKKKFKHRYFPLGYATNVNELMSVSDVIVTKPGGITTAEALSKRLPMVIVKPIPGQEANNTAFLTSKGAAAKVTNPKEIALLLQDLIDHPEKLASMREAAASISKPHASMDIAKLLLNLGNG